MFYLPGTLCYTTQHKMHQVIDSAARRKQSFSNVMELTLITSSASAEIACNV